MSKLLIFTITIAAVAIIYNTQYYEYVTTFFDYWFTKSVRKGRIFTAEELMLYNGVLEKEMYLSILGIVFNVTSGAQFYGPGHQYNVFLGRDASKSFVTGNFEETEASDDVVGLHSDDYKALHDWLLFYRKQYPKIGVMVGRYYDEYGRSTQYNREIKSLIKDAAKRVDKAKDQKKRYPPCNVEWDANKGTTLWCTKKSGGIERDFIGYPRKYYEPGADNHRCACIAKEELNMSNLEEYEWCDSDSHTCHEDPKITKPIHSA